jgi:uncharacterized SAM-binding protein YcdF (DUF218 family)
VTRRRLVLLAAAVLAAVLLVACVRRHSILGAAGDFLDVGVAPRHADAAIVLAGGLNGERILRAGELVRDGYVPTVYVSGPPFIYGRRECDLAIDYAVAHGFPRSSFQCLPNHGLSTLEEARQCCAALRAAGLRSVLLVTTAFHTRRATAMYARVCPQIAYHAISAESPRYRLHEWYAEREGRKDVLTEYLKLATWRFGL